MKNSISLTSEIVLYAGVSCSTDLALSVGGMEFSNRVKYHHPRTEHIINSKHGDILAMQINILTKSSTLIFSIKNLHKAAVLEKFRILRSSATTDSE